MDIPNLLNNASEKQSYMTPSCTNADMKPYDENDDNAYHSDVDTSIQETDVKNEIDRNKMATSIDILESDIAEGTNSMNMDDFPPIAVFDREMEEYINNLHEKKRQKSLISPEMYDLIMQVLKDPKRTNLESPQFRFWVRKMFKLVPAIDLPRNGFRYNHRSSDEKWFVVRHDPQNKDSRNKDLPVATKDKIFDILVECHHAAGHGGRDKTMNEVKKSYSWIPKDLVSKFVRHCPTCNGRGGNHPSRIGRSHGKIGEFCKQQRLNKQKPHSEVNHHEREQQYLYYPQQEQYTQPISSSRNHAPDSNFRSPSRSQSASPGLSPSPLNSISTANSCYRFHHPQPLQYYPYYHHVPSQRPESDVLDVLPPPVVASKSAASSSYQYQYHTSYPPAHYPVEYNNAYYNILPHYTAAEIGHPHPNRESSEHLRNAQYLHYNLHAQQQQQQRYASYSYPQQYHRS